VNDGPGAAPVVDAEHQMLAVAEEDTEKYGILNYILFVCCTRNGGCSHQTLPNTAPLAKESL